MKKRILIVDGYNVLNAWRPAQGMSARTLAEAREDLAAQLMDYAGFSGQKVILVYDAWQSERAVRTQESAGPLTVVYTHKNETADHYIERLCDRYAPRAELGQIEVRVATSDLVEPDGGAGQARHAAERARAAPGNGADQRREKERIRSCSAGARDASGAAAPGGRRPAGGHAAGRKARGGLKDVVLRAI